jgi:hypothetical protein
MLSRLRNKPADIGKVTLTATIAVKPKRQRLPAALRFKAIASTLLHLVYAISILIP